MRNCSQQIRARCFEIFRWEGCIWIVGLVVVILFLFLVVFKTAKVSETNYISEPIGSELSNGLSKDPEGSFLYLFDTSNLHYSHNPPYGSLDRSIKHGSLLFYSGLLVEGSLPEPVAGPGAACFRSPFVISKECQECLPKALSNSFDPTRGNGTNLLGSRVVGEFYIRAEHVSRSDRDVRSAEWLRTMFGVCNANQEPKSSRAMMNDLLDAFPLQRGFPLMKMNMEAVVFSSQAFSRFSFSFNSLYEAHRPFPRGDIDLDITARGKGESGNSNWILSSPARLSYVGHSTYTYCEGNCTSGETMGSWETRSLGAVHLVWLPKILSDKMKSVGMMEEVEISEIVSSFF